MFSLTMCICTQLFRNETKKKQNTIASHLTNPLTLFQHLVALFTYFGDGKADSDRAEASETRVLQATCACNDVPASVDLMAEVNDNKVEDSKPITPGVTCSLEDFRSTFLRCLMDKITTTLAETLNPLVSHLCSQPFSKVQFVRMSYESVDNPSNCLRCPEAFILSNILHHIKKKHNLSKYTDIFGYHKERELRRDIEKLLRHIHNCQKTASVSSQWEQLCIFLDDAIHFLTEIETGLLLGEIRLTDGMSVKIGELTKMKDEINLAYLHVYTPTPPSLY